MIDEEMLINDLKNNYLVKNDGTWNDAMDRAVELVKTAPKIGEWIPCSDRLPEKLGKYYIVSVKSSISDLEYTRPALYDKDGFAIKSNTKVIAWQPLPKPYHEH